MGLSPIHSWMQILKDLHPQTAKALKVSWIFHSHSVKFEFIEDCKWNVADLDAKPPEIVGAKPCFWNQTLGLGYSRLCSMKDSLTKENTYFPVLPQQRPPSFFPVLNCRISSSKHEICLFPPWTLVLLFWVMCQDYREARSRAPLSQL